MRMCNTFIFRAFALIMLTSTAYAEQMPLRLCKPDEVQKIYQILKDVHEIFTFYKIEYWIDGGTLLGAVRNCGLIPWDDDLDLCIFEEQEQQFLALIPLLNSLGYEVIGMQFGYKIYARDGQVIPKRPFTYPNCDIAIMTRLKDDVFYKMHWPLERTHGPVSLKVDELYPLRHYLFGPLRVIGPNNPYNYLTKWYGTIWSTVAWQSFDHHIDKSVNRVEMKLSPEHRLPAVPAQPLENRFSAPVVKLWPTDFAHDYPFILFE